MACILDSSLRRRHACIGLTIAISTVLGVGFGTAAWADPCVVPPDSTGTVSLPPEGCAYLTGDEVHAIIDGLPPGTTIELAPIHLDFICRKSDPGNMDHCGTDDGTGGENEVFDSTAIVRMRGTGDLAGFQRDIPMQLFCQAHTDPHDPSAPVQDFDTEMVALQSLPLPAGDPDFEQLSIVAGSGFGLPSPGHTTLTRLGPPGSSFAVDSFFDIEYRIDFVGTNGGQLEGLGGSTTGVVHMAAGDAACAPTPDGTACQQVAPCDPVAQTCEPKCVNYNAATGETRVIDCGCANQGDCHVEFTLPPSGPNLRGATGNDCVVAEGPPGTVTLPPAGCAYLSPNDVHKIIEGLPAGTTLILDAVHDEFSAQIPPVTGGTLGGEIEQFNSILGLNIQGNAGGTLPTFNRTLFVPIQCEVHTGLRNPGDPVQSFPNDMFRLQGQLFGDPDFCTLNITGGTDFGLPSPGQTTLTDLGGGSFRVDSFFDIEYRIEFEGCPGSALEGYAGTTTASIRMNTGLAPACDGNCPPGSQCVDSIVQNPDGSIDFCCSCEPTECAPTPDGSSCAGDCAAGEECTSVCADYDPVTGDSSITDCECRNPGECQVVAPVDTGADLALRGTAGNPCVLADDAGGTVTLPPIGCDYLSADEVHMIIDGLPPGTTLELAPIHKDFICDSPQGTSFPDCPPPGAGCEQDGGDMGGKVDCFTSDLDLTVTGNPDGAFPTLNHSMTVQVACRVDTGPRTLNQAVQSFDSEMVFLQGGKVDSDGDPVFESLTMTAGSGFGMPSPGHTTLTRLGPAGSSFTVDSFFDIEYRIDYVGRTPGPLAGTSGSTTGTIRMRTGAQPTCEGTCPGANDACIENTTLNPDGTIHVCCDCLPNCKPSDVDCNGTTEAADIVVIRQVANFNKSVCVDPPVGASARRADVDRNGFVEAADIVVVRQVANFNTSTGPCNCVPHDLSACP